MAPAPDSPTPPGLQLQAVSLVMDHPALAAERARRFALVTLDRQPDALRQDSVLVVSELITNAWMHGQGPCVLRVRQRTGWVRVEVEDLSTDLPRPQRPRPDRPGGHGLEIVQGLALRWGITVNHTGKTVWAELGNP